MGLVFSRNLISLFIFWEITAIACWRLIGFFRSTTDVIRADKAFLVTVFGALMMLAGFIMIASEAGSFDLEKIRAYSQAASISNVAIIFILFGIFSKSSTLPLHTWLPDAGVAPSPVTALLHAAVLVKIGVYVFARLFIATFVNIDPIWHTIIPAIAAASALVSAGAALIDTDLKRIIAYSTISQLAFIFLGLAVGGKMAIAGGLLFILMHGIAKGGLFLCAGIVEQNSGTKDIRGMGGLAAKMPVTAISFALCAFSVMGIPPFGGFFSKYLVISGAMMSGQVAIAVVFTAGAVLTVLYLLRTFMMVFMGETKLTHYAEVSEGSFTMVSSVALLAALVVVVSIMFSAPSFFANAAVNQMLGVGH
jgi:NADH:ubiquinone oxidoreductase subunit 5 (subunit L)/multisubunit Na+/H+ antiporter MnhA subunit